MNKIMGKPKDDVIVKEAAKEAVVKAVKKKYPLVPERAVRKKIDKLDKKISGKKKGFRL